MRESMKPCSKLSVQGSRQRRGRYWLRQLALYHAVLQVDLDGIYEEEQVVLEQFEKGTVTAGQLQKLSKTVYREIINWLSANSFAKLQRYLLFLEKDAPL